MAGGVTPSRLILTPSPATVKMDDPNITVEEYIRLEEERAQRHGQTFNWQTATFLRKLNSMKEMRNDCFADFEAKFPSHHFGNIIAAIPIPEIPC
ncbi:hypothetical protein Tco_1447835 [Tanacetum coccineum]